MRIIVKRTLREFWLLHPDAEQPLLAWYQVAKRADWATPAEVKAQFKNASLVGHERVVFNIAGNKYRLIAAINYAFQAIYIRFVGTHNEYDQIDAREV